jgi:hypothetical protein
VEFDAILIGSAARAAQTPRSDVDILVIADQQLEKPRVEQPIHLQIISTDNFLRRLHDADDFACWCVRYGVPMTDSGLWKRLKESPDATTWPRWKEKIGQATSKLILASQLLQIEDLEAAAEEMLYAVSHTARALLLREGKFPLSRPEMVEQLSMVGQNQLSELLSNLLNGRDDTSYLRHAQGLLKKLLTNLDVRAYRDTALHYTRTERSKRGKAAAVKSSGAR